MLDTLPIGDDLEKFLVSEYFKHGSIDKVFKIHSYNLPISFASYHRLLNKYGVVKSAGPNSKLSESLHFLSLLNTYKLPLERIYHKYSPTTLKVSTNTLHRVLHNVRLGITSKVGVALLVSGFQEPYKLLVGQDDSLANSQMGRRGDWSLPMGYTRQQDSFETGIKRVLQQEVFTQEVLGQSFPHKIVPKNPKPLFILNIADIKVFVFKINLRKEYLFSSYKLKNLSFYSPDEILSLKTRAGVNDIFKLYLMESEADQYISEINQSLALAPARFKNQ